MCSTLRATAAAVARVCVGAGGIRVYVNTGAQGDRPRTGTALAMCAHVVPLLAGVAHQPGLPLLPLAELLQHITHADLPPMLHLPVYNTRSSRPHETRHSQSANHQHPGATIQFAVRFNNLDCDAEFRQGEWERLYDSCGAVGVEIALREALWRKHHNGDTT
ncbi:hypothetical protein C8J57DRAFT_1473227 [Mycena rebaudengoi]|nr:hypothetical protein C8J57DRAFT_1473227 [Mycena rebaudengoi]